MTTKSKSIKALLTLLVLLAASCGSKNQNSNEQENNSNDNKLVAIADTGDCKESSKKVAGAIRATNYDLIIAGDLAYPMGSQENFNQCFTPLFGDYLNKIHAVPGDNEYKTPNATPFFNTLGSSAGQPNQGWLSFEKNGWKIIGLNSQCPRIGGCDESSPEYKWLEQELKQTNTQCIAAFWHTPLVTSSPNYSGFPRMEPLYRLLQQNSTDILIVGNSHHYERYDRINEKGQPDPNGIMNFTAGTGGAFPSPVSSDRKPGSASAETNIFGYLELTLEKDSFKWEFITVKGDTEFQDKGEDSC